MPVAPISSSARCSSPSARLACLVRRNPLVMFMSIELMLNAVNLSWPSRTF